MATWEMAPCQTVALGWECVVVVGRRQEMNFFCQIRNYANFTKVLEEMCKALIGFMVLSLSLKGYFVSITLH